MKARKARQRRAYRYVVNHKARFPLPEGGWPVEYLMSTAARRRYLDAIGFMVPKTGKARRGRR